MPPPHGNPPQEPRHVNPCSFLSQHARLSEERDSDSAHSLQCLQRNVRHTAYRYLIWEQTGYSAGGGEGVDQGRRE